MTSWSFLLVVLFSVTPVVSGGGFLHGASAGSRFDQGSRNEEFESAMADVQGCGGVDTSKSSAAIERTIAPMWKALPKNQNDKVEWRMLRYVAHRYFMQQSSLLIRGFEPGRKVNETDLGSAEILRKHVPSLVEKMIASRHALDGFKLEDAVAMIAALERVIFNAESVLLEVVYNQQAKSPQQTLTEDEAFKLAEAYMVHWMMGDDKEGVRILMRNRTLLETAFPHWFDIRHFAQGMIKRMEFDRGTTKAALTQSYSFDDVHEAVGGITRTFASYWETECQTIKASLSSMDKTNTGRVSLSEFYGANADGEWRFGESENYLRELGALDESSAWRGKQVIISNYLLGANNCIVTTPHYLVCCVNECEEVLNEVEDAIGAPAALPDDILPLIAKMSNFNDEKPKLDAALRGQLHRIGQANGGKVPLHGRLFSQWLHYVFPLECPFPHKAGTFKSLTPLEFGGNYIASETEVSTHASKRGSDTEAVIEEELQRMSQWSEEEELHADYSILLRAPWDSSRSLLLAVGGLAVFFGVVFTSNAKKGGMHTATAHTSAYESKAHFV